MDVSSHEDVDEEIEDPERIKSASSSSSSSDTMQAMDKVIRFSDQFDNRNFVRLKK